MAEYNTVANLLVETMTNAGWIDDCDELLYDIAENDSIDAAQTRVDEIQEAANFVQEFGTEDNAKTMKAVAKDVIENLVEIKEDLS